MPSKTWVRLRVPSITWKWTRTRSPGIEPGNSLQLALLDAVDDRAHGRRVRASAVGPLDADPEKARYGGPRARHMVADSRRRGKAGASAHPRRPALLQAPFADPGVVAGEQDLGHLPAAIARRACVVRVLGRSAERLRERLLDHATRHGRAPRQLAHHRVGDDHRRQLTAGEHVGTDRDRIVGEVLADPVVDSLVATAQERQMRLGGELGGEPVVELPAGRREHDGPRGPGPIAVGGLERRVDDVDAQHHPGTAAVGRVVHLTAAERGRVAVVEDAELGAQLERVTDVTLGARTTRTTPGRG